MWKLIIQNMSGDYRISQHLAYSVKGRACHMLAFQLWHVTKPAVLQRGWNDTADTPACDIPLISHAMHEPPLRNVAGAYFPGDAPLFCWTVCSNLKSQLALEIRGKTLSKLFEWCTLTGDWFLSSHNANHHCYCHLFYDQEINDFFWIGLSKAAWQEPLHNRFWQKSKTK